MKILMLPRKFLMQGKSLAGTINTLKKFILIRNQRFAINFSELEEIRKGDLIVLLAQIEKSNISNNNKIFRVGRFTSVNILKEVFKTTGTVFHTYHEISVPSLSDSEKQTLINPVVIDSVVRDLKKIGIKNYYFPFNIILTELIGNAVEHGIQNKKINWWLTHEIDRRAKVAKYTFVDMGSGIIHSHMKAGVPIKYKILGPRRIIKDSFFGILGSSTKLSNRGRGLPQLRDMIERNIVSNFILITNSVTLTFENNSFVTARNPDFTGTYFSWTIDQNNYQKWKNSQ